MFVHVVLLNAWVLEYLNGPKVVPIFFVLRNKLQITTLLLNVLYNMHCVNCYIVAVSGGSSSTKISILILERDALVLSRMKIFNT